MNKTILSTVIGAALLANAAIASADTAEAAYKRGKAALKAGHVHEACQEFETSDKLDSKIETELNLAACYADDGKLVTAANLYRSIADKDPKVDRKKTSVAKATKLEAKAPKLRLLLSTRPDGLAITVDGVSVPADAKDIPVDAGPHEVVATAPGFEGHASPAVDGARPIVDVIVRMDPKAEPAPTPKPLPAPTPAPTPMVTTTTTTTATSPAPMSEPMDVAPTHGHHRRNGTIAGVVGIGLLATSVVFLAAASSKDNDEHNLCPNATCHTTGQAIVYDDFRRDARNDRGIAYGVGIGGVAFVGLGAYLLLSSHHHEDSHVAVQVDHGGGALSYFGRF